MGYRRFIDPAIWTSRELNRAPLQARHLFMYLFSTCDDWGRLKDDPYRFRHGAFADDPVTEDDVVAWVDVLHEKGLIARYKASDGSALIWVRKFHTYQPMRHRRVSVLDRHPEDTMQDAPPGAVTPAEEGGGLPQPAGAASTAETCGEVPQDAACIDVVTPIDIADAVPAALQAAAGTDVGGSIEEKAVPPSAETPPACLPETAHGGHDEAKEALSGTNDDEDRRLDATLAEKAIAVFERVAPWRRGLSHEALKDAYQRLRMGFTPAQGFLANALEASKQKYPAKWLAMRLVLARAPPDKALIEAGRLLREEGC